MFRLLSEAKTGVILLKIEIFYNKTGLRFPLSCKVNETFFILTLILEKNLGIISKTLYWRTV